MKRIKSVPMGFRAVKFGLEVQLAREDAGLNKSELAIVCDVSDSVVGYVERGEEPSMKMVTFLSFCNALDLDPRAYFELGE